MGTPIDEVILQFRRQLAAEIVRSLDPSSQHVISASFGIPQPRMSELNLGIVSRCTVEWLIRRVYRMGGTVTLTVTLGDAQRAWTRARFAEMRARRAAAMATPAAAVMTGSRGDGGRRDRGR